MSDVVLIAIACLVAGLAAGALIAFVVRGRSAKRDDATEQSLMEFGQQLNNLSREVQVERELSAERLTSMKETFSAAAADALQRNSRGFLDLATETFERYRASAVTEFANKEKAIEGLIQPVKDSLNQFSSAIQELEKSRVGAYEGIREQVTGLVQLQKDLRSETANLVSALKAPQVRGRWGEIQLRRVVEFAVMIDRCDFVEQQSAKTPDGRLRPDLIVRLPGNKTIVVDAKAPIDKYLLAVEANSDGERRLHLEGYAGQVRGHMTQLAGKNYWEQFNSAPEFVFMFLPGESFYRAALDGDATLIESGTSQRVIIATPVTLITLLKTVASGWRQEKLAEDAEKIGHLGKELYERLGTLSEHFAAIGSSLGSAVEKYNSALATLESRVLVSARRFKEMPITATDKEIKQASQIESVPRQIQAPELADGPILLSRQEH
jgi:DNA recombination protein RmuC